MPTGAPSRTGAPAETRTIPATSFTEVPFPDLRRSPWPDTPMTGEHESGTGLVAIFAIGAVTPMLR